MKQIQNMIGKIIRIFGNQKQNGWFAGIFQETYSGKKFRISGIYRNDIDVSLEYEISANHTMSVYGEQYVITTMKPHIRNNHQALIQYLSSNSFHGIGKVTAKKIVNEFGQDTLDVIVNRPDELKTRLQLSDKEIQILVNGETSVSIENKLQKMIPFLSKTLMTKIINTYLNEEYAYKESEILNMIKNNPYRLLYDLENVSFPEIDKMALHLKFDKYDKIRIEECYRYALSKYVMETKNMFISTKNTNEYHAFYQHVLQYISTNYDGKNNHYSQTDYDTVNSLFLFPDNINGICLIKEEDGSFSIYEEHTYTEELSVAKILAEQLLRKSVFVQMTNCNMTDIEFDIGCYERKHRIQLDDSQRMAVIMSLLSPISIINGGPGHGKTSTIDCILYIWNKHIPDKKPILSAPTGRAVAVLKNATGNEYEVSTTMRHIVEMQKAKKNANERNALEKKYRDNLMILDEGSMIGVKTAFEFLRLFQNCQFLVVGDVQQLPSIAYGQFFKDICDCNLFVKNCLTVNHRAEGAMIVKNAEAIANGDVSSIDYSDKTQFELLPFYGDYSDKIIQTYEEFVYKHLIKKDGLNIKVLDEKAMKNICILCPTRYGPTGYLLLNKRIQDMVNPYDKHARVCERGYEIKSTHMYINESYNDVKLRVGDRVMQTKNRSEAKCVLIAGKKTQVSYGVFNGDIGTIVSFQPQSNTLIMRLDDGRETVIPEENMNELILAYAISIHKSQGCEFDDIIFSAQDILTMSTKNINDSFVCRNLLYTAVTRAKKHVKLIGNEYGIRNCIESESKPRNSNLTIRIRKALEDLKNTSQKSH